ncbi:MAG: tripartite tricarboxylate transporter substrate binding protein [Betaproteobacteria bacterium]|nr:tripartite tricarboxylate transporter substrate binding protein [Betaproteobacteria bacterium]
MKRFAILSSVLILFACAAAIAQDYPTKPVTIYVPFAAGGGTDLSVRMLEEAVSKNLGQKVVIVNKTGTATIYQVVTGTPDGYNLVVGSTGNLAAVPHNPGAPYTREDYVPVVQFTSVPALLIVPANSPFHSMADIIAAARKTAPGTPGTLKVGISPNGSISHLAAIQLERAFNIKFGYIPHKSNGDVVTAVLGGHVDIGSVDIAAAGPKMASNSVRGIALYREARLPTFPELRTLKEQGADISFGFYNVILAPKGTPDRIVAVVHDAFRKALQDPAVIERSKRLNLPIAYLGPQDSRMAINQSYDIFGKLLDELGLKKK